MRKLMKYDEGMSGFEVLMRWNVNFTTKSPFKHLFPFPFFCSHTKSTLGHGDNIMGLGFGLS